MAAAPVVEKNDQGNGILSFVFACFFAVLFLVIVAICCYFDRAPSWAFVLYLAMSIVTYIVYGRDKTAAQEGAWRTPEDKLHQLALFGGWPGALVAQQLFRHKSNKSSFRYVFWVTVALNICAFIVLTTPSAVTTLKSLMITINNG